MTNNTSPDIIVVGAGLWGCTVARILSDHNLHVLIVEKRKTIGGNVDCSIDESTGIEIHNYGPHVFHTDKKDVWDFIRRFTEFNGYTQRTLVNYNGHMYPMPFGLALINSFYNINLKPNEVSDFIKKEAKKSGITNPKNLEEQAICLVGEGLYNAFIKGYTFKQWGTDPKNISPDVIKRIPVRSNYDTNYFNDQYQGIPINGYYSLFSNLINSPRITVMLNTDWIEWRKYHSELSCQVFYSGPVDKLLSYKYGELPWRSLRFEFERVKINDFQGTSVINYPDIEIPYTRITEFKHFHPENSRSYNSNETIICKEFSNKWDLQSEPYYPIATSDSECKFKMYELDIQNRNIILGGRLGKYKYMDMDDTIFDAIITAKEFINKNNLHGMPR